MLKYLVVLLADNSVAYCHYVKQISGEQTINVDVLRRAIHWAWTENLIIQFVFPANALSTEIYEVIETTSHIKIMPQTNAESTKADIVVCDSIEQLPSSPDSRPHILLVEINSFISERQHIIEHLQNLNRLTISFTDIERFSDDDVPAYSRALQDVSDAVAQNIKQGNIPQINILTDRILLTKMNNCNAGFENITLAPNGKLYICPAFYYSSPDKNIGSLDEGLNIANPQLYDIANAPICKHCDAWHCHRCVWLNQRLTREVNTPSHCQCVMAHTEREAARLLIENTNSNIQIISKLDYYDPFENMINWNK